MARTTHQTVQKVAAFEVGKRRGKASHKTLKSAASQGRAPVSNPRKAPPGWSVVPASVAALPPGLVPPMSSMPGPGGRGLSSLRQSTSSPRGRVKTFNIQGAPYGGTTIWSGGGVATLKRSGKNTGG